jgi:hypothetical protein
MRLDTAASVGRTDQRTAGCDDVVLFPCSGDLEQFALLARVVR